MGPSAILLLGMLIATVIVVVVIVQLHSTRLLNQTYGRLAARFGGRVLEAGLFQRPSVIFPHRGVWARVDVYSTGGKHPTYYTQLHVDWPDQSLRLEVYPERFFNRLGKLLGVHDIQLGAPQFDRNYIITGNDPVAIRELLSDGLRAQIDLLRCFRGNDDVYVGICRGELLVKKRGFLREFPPLEQFVTLGLELYEQATLVHTAGVEFIEPPDERPVVEVTCQICGEPIEAEAVLCRSCKTPHHRECWEYFGACSTYGCGQQRYDRPRRRVRRRQPAEPRSATIDSE